MSWNLSCLDWEERMRDGRSLVPSLPLHTAEGDRAVRIFNKLRLSDVPGTPALEIAAGDWFRDIVRALFGSLDPITKERAIRELMLLVPKKNSKTSYGALLMLTALLMNQRPRAAFVMTAPVQDVAELAYGQASGAIALDPVLSKKLHVRDHLKTIIHRETGAELQIMTFNPATVTGQKPAGILIDELHVVAKMAKAASAIRQLRGGMLPIPEAFMAFITTQSEEAPSGVFRAELMKARAIRDGKLHGVMLPVLYEFPEVMQKDPAQWRDSGNWPMVTPNAGRSISIARLEEEFATAEATSEEELRAWASQHLNVEIGLALMSDRWVGADYWELQAVEAFTLDDLIAQCEVITVGIDGGGMDDLLGFAVLGRHAKTQKWMLWTHAWAHSKVLERRKSEAPKFKDFRDDGDLTFAEVGADFDQVAALVAKIHKAQLLDKIGVDASGLGSMLDAMVKAGIPEDKFVAVSQGWKMTGSIKTAERKLAEGELVHPGQRMMNWCVGNAKVEPRGNAILITKQAAGTAKIDPLMAAFNAINSMALNPKSPRPRHQMFFV